MKHNGTIADQCKQRGVLCHIGLVKDRGGHLVNQPRLSKVQIVANSICKTNLKQYLTQMQYRSQASPKKL